MAVAPAHIECITAFINARLRAAHTARAAADDDQAARALRALRRTVGNLAARSEVPAPPVRNTAPVAEAARNLVLACAWSDLRDIAAQWADHADYAIWFAAQEGDLLDCDAGPAPGPTA